MNLSDLPLDRFPLVLVAVGHSERGAFVRLRDGRVWLWHPDNPRFSSEDEAQRAIHSGDFVQAFSRYDDWTELGKSLGQSAAEWRRHQPPANFLLARIAEEEKLATLSIQDGTRWSVGADSVVDHYWYTLETGENSHGLVSDSPDQNLVAHMAKWDPTRALAECEAKRRIVEDHAPTDTAHSYADAGGLHAEPACRQCTRSTQSHRVTSEWDVADRVIAPCDTIRALLTVYRDHPDYQEEWRP